MNYPFQTIWLNGRFVSLDTILKEEIIPLSFFENHTLIFIREWLSGQKNFTLNTSGSTGTPKTISVTREQMIASARLTEKAVKLEKFSNALVCIDTKYIGGKMMLVRCFVTGMRIWALDPCACPLQKIPVDLCVNFAAFVPLQIKSMLVSKHPHLLNNPDVAIIGGAPLDEKTVVNLQDLLCKFYATYGMTETISHVALRTLNGVDRTEEFYALPEIKLEKNDNDCLVIETPYLSDKVITNDIVAMKRPGGFKWLGRLDNVINSGGVKVIPEKVEAAIEKLFFEAGISNEFFIHGLPDDKLGTMVGLVLETTGNANNLVEKILPNISSELSLYERPRVLLVSPGFIRTENGKLNRMKSLETVNAVIPGLI